MQPVADPGRCARLWRWLYELAMRVIAWLCGAGDLSGLRRQHSVLLVLDLDGTLVHHTEVSGPGKNTLCTKGQWFFIAIRPHTQEFLAFAAARFDLAVFTASTQDYAEQVLRILRLSVPLYSRQHCKKVSDYYEKDLKVLRRPLWQVRLLDDNAQSYHSYPQNGLPISCWTGDPMDEELLRIMRVLSQ